MAESDYSAEYVTAAAEDILDVNVYVDIDGVTEKFSMKPVTGLANNVPNLLLDPKFSGANVDINSPKTPLQTVTFTLLDEDGAVSLAFKEKDLHEKTVKVYTSPDASLDVSKYGLKAQYRLKEIRAKDGNTYQIKCNQTGELLLQRLIIGTTILTADIDNIQTTGITVADSSEFSGAGTKKAYIGEERISFTGVDASGELTGVSRGVDGTTADEHKEGDDFHIYRSLTSTNFVDYMLQLMISPGGGGSYDVLDFGMGIDESLIDVTEFERIRDETGYLSTATFNLEFKGDESNFLSFIEDHFLQPSALRFWYRDNGKISLLILAEPTPASSRPTVVKNDMVNGLMPQWIAHSRRIVNIIKVKLNYNITNDQYERELTFTDQNSIDKYGKKPIVSIDTRVLQSGSLANSFLTSFSNKYFSFYSTPAPELDRTDLMPDKQFFDPGNNVELSHPDLPNLIDGKRGILQNIVQIIGKTFDFKSSVSRYNLFYARLLNIRAGFIAPTGTVKAGSWSTTIFELETADLGKFEVGDVVTLWNETWASPSVEFSQSTITAVDGDEITVSPAFSTTPTEGYRLRYADYDQVQESQHRYAFVGKTGGADFNDGGSPYKIGA